MIPCFSNASTALLPSSRAFLTSFSPRAFSSAFVKASVPASTGNPATSVDTAKEEIPGAHPSRSDFDWDAKVDYLMSGRGILRVRTPTEGGKVHVQNGFGIAHIAIQHGSARAQLASTDAHEFTPEGVARRRSRVDIDLIALQVIQSLEHQTERFLHQLVGGAGRLLFKDVDR